MKFAYCLNNAKSYRITCFIYNNNHISDFYETTFCLLRRCCWKISFFITCGGVESWVAVEAKGAISLVSIDFRIAWLPWLHQHITKKVFVSCFRTHCIEKLERCEKNYHNLPVHHQDLIPTFLEHMNAIRGCINHNAGIIDHILGSLEKMWENKENPIVEVNKDIYSCSNIRPMLHRRNYSLLPILTWTRSRRP